MITEAEARELVSDVFEEEALVIGGLVATHQFDDSAVWSLMRGFDAIRHRALTRIGCPAGVGEARIEERSTPTTHPAVEEFLRKVEEERQ